MLLIAVPALGDVLLCTPLLRALREAHSGAALHVLVRAGHGAVLEGNPHVDQVIEVNKHPRVPEYLALLRRILRRYDLVLSNSTSDRAALYALLAGSFRVSAVPPLDARLPWKRWLYHRWIELDAQGRHTLVQTNLLGELIGLDPGGDVVPPRSAGSLAVLGTLLGADWRERRLAVMHPTPALAYKRWQPAGWRAVAAHLHGAGIEVVVTSGRGAEEIHYVEEQIGFAPGTVTSLAGKLRLGDVTMLLEHCAVYVGVDTLVTHMAAAAGARTVALFGPTSPVVWGPWPAGLQSRRSPYTLHGSQRAGNVRLLQGLGHCVPCGREGCLDRRDSHSDCLDGLEQHRVIAAVDELLAAS